MTDDQTHDPQAPTPPEGRTRFPARGAAFTGAALLLTAVSVAAGVACWLRSAGEPPPPASRPGPFRGWPEQIDFALVLTAQQHGYLLPCGCSRPQYGGLERRYNFLDELRNKYGWKVVALDLGDIPQKEGPAKLPNVQGLIKYIYSMKALREMGYTAVSFGAFEGALSLSNVFDEWAINEPRPPILGANLEGKKEEFPDKARRSGSYVGSWEITEPVPGIRVGVLGIIGTHDPDKNRPGEPKSVAEQIAERDTKFEGKKAALRFERANAAIPRALQEMQAEKEPPNFRVLLYQGLPERARECARVLHQFNVILCLAEEDEPPGQPEVVGNTFIIRVGHKGKNLGVVGVKRTNDPAKPFQLYYHLQLLDEKYLTPKDKQTSHPIVALMEQYTRELKAENYLARYGQVTHSVQFGVQQLAKYKARLAEYAGTEACKKCHEHAYKIWEASPHAHAYRTLVEDPEPPHLRQFDGECIVCHTVGFGYKKGFTNEKDTPNLKDVGCESCHGPSKLHKENPNDLALRALINPWKARPGETPKQREKRILQIEGMCRNCHDSDNDVHWDFAKWEKGKIAHYNEDKAEDEK
jgi:hypothetical protein